MLLKNLQGKYLMTEANDMVGSETFQSHLMVKSAVSGLSFDFSECENWMKNMEILRDGGL